MSDPAIDQTDESTEPERIEFDEDVEDQVEAPAEEPGEAAVGVKQRLRLHVPNIYGNLTLGEAVNNVDQQGHAYPGFGVQTGGHVFLSAGTKAAPEGAATANNFMMLQGKSGVTALSPEGSVFVAGRTGVNVGTCGGVTMAGEGGVLIAGGTMGSFFTEDFGVDFDGRTQAHDDPAPPKWASTQKQIVSGIATFINAHDTAVAFTTDALRTARHAALTPSIKPKDGLLARALSGFDAAAAFASTVGSAADMLEREWPMVGPVPSALANRASSSTVLFGQSGTIVSSPLSVAVYAGHGGAVVGSKGCIDLLCEESLHAHASKAVSISGAAVSVLADGDAEFLSKSVCTVASRTTSTFVLGAHVYVGSITPRPGQADTTRTFVLGTNVEARAANEAVVYGGNKLELSSHELIDGKAKAVSLAATETLTADGEHVALGGTKDVKLAVGNTAVLLEKDQLTIGWNDSGLQFNAVELAEREQCLEFATREASSEDPSTQKAAAAAAARVKEIDEKLDSIKRRGLNNALVIKRTGIEVVFGGISFELSRGKAKVGKHLVVAK